MKRSKYKSKYSECREGHKHQSKKEADACSLLHMMQGSGVIKNLRVQPTYILQPAFKSLDGKKVRAIKYKADFEFYDNEQGRKRVVDIKGFPTPVYAVKRKLFDYKMRDKGMILEENI